jgi:hypothetical protein
MERLEQEIDELMKKKGFSSSRMTDEEFIGAIEEKADATIPRVVSKAIYQVMQEVYKQDMKRIGRGERCLFFGNMHKEPCSENTNIIEMLYKASMNIELKFACSDCSKCQHYRKIKWWQRLVAFTGQPLILMEIVIIMLGICILAAAILSPEVRIATIAFWFMIFLATRIHNFYLHGQVNKLKAKNLLTIL